MKSCSREANFSKIGLLLALSGQLKRQTKSKYHDNKIPKAANSEYYYQLQISEGSTGIDILMRRK